MKKQYDIFDLAKIILAFMVVAIHTDLLPPILYPWLRLAVPLFFLISSYLLHMKIKSQPEEQKLIIKRYIIRMLKMYLFWFVVLIPVTIYVRKSWFEDGLAIGITNIILKPFLGSTFIASWYLTASIIGTLVVEKLSKYSYKISIPIVVLSYLLCCCASGYSFLFGCIGTVTKIVQPQFSFFVSLIYILFGKIILENRIQIRKRTARLLIIVALVALYVEWLITSKLTGTINNDCYIMLAPASILIFNYMKDITIKIKKPKLLRQMSSFIYPVHASLAVIIGKVIEHFISDNTISGILNFATTGVICVILFILVKKLEKHITILKLSY